MCKVKITEAVRYPDRIQASLLFAVPAQAGPLNILPAQELITEPTKIYSSIDNLRKIVDSLT